MTLVASSSRPIKGVGGTGRLEWEGGAAAWWVEELRAADSNRARSAP